MGLFNLKRKTVKKPKYSKEEIDEIMSGIRSQNEKDKIVRDKLVKDKIDECYEKSSSLRNAKTPMEYYLAAKNTMFWKQTVNFSIKDKNGKDRNMQLSDMNSNNAKAYPEIYALCPFVVNENLYEMSGGNMKAPFDKYPDYPDWMLEALEKSLTEYENMADKGFSVEVIRNNKTSGIYPEIEKITLAYFLGDLGDYNFAGVKVAEARLMLLLNKIKDYVENHPDKDRAENVKEAYAYIKENDPLGKMLV